MWHDTRYNNALSVIMLSVFILSVILLSVIVLSVIMLSVIMLSVTFNLLLCWIALCWVLLYWMSLWRVSLCTMSLCWVSLCWVSLCWMSSIQWVSLGREWWRHWVYLQAGLLKSNKLFSLQLQHCLPFVYLTSQNAYRATEEMTVDKMSIDEMVLWPTCLALATLYWLVKTGAFH
jgi:hypothetical protein